MIRDLMLESLERHFGLAAPHPVEWLSDNGSCYTGRETVEFASWLGLMSRVMSVRSCFFVLIEYYLYFIGCV
jgi:transposase InsO family protein